MSNYKEYKLGNSSACNLVGRPQKGTRTWRRNTSPLSFEAWLKQGMERYQKQGIVFELVTPSLMRIKRPGQTNLLRTCANFRNEYETEYLAKF